MTNHNTLPMSGSASETKYGPGFTLLLKTIMDLVEKYPPSPYDPGHGEHGTRVALPTSGLQLGSDAFIGYGPRTRTIEGQDESLRVTEIAHANVESLYRRNPTTRFGAMDQTVYQHTLTDDGRVIREVIPRRDRSLLPVMQTRILSDEAAAGLAKRLDQTEG